MNNQEILHNAPEGAVCVDDGNDYFNAEGRMWSEHCEQFDYHDIPFAPIGLQYRGILSCM